MCTKKWYFLTIHLDLAKSNKNQNKFWNIQINNKQHAVHKIQKVIYIMLNTHRNTCTQIKDGLPEII